MTLGKLIGELTELRGQEYDIETIVGWINEIEGQINADVIGQSEETEFSPYIYERDEEKELLVQDRFKDVYINYLFSKIDFYNQETERYNNDVVMFNAAYEAYAAWHIRTHKPKKTRYFSKF